MKVLCSYHFVSALNNGFGNAQIETEENFPLSLKEIRRMEKEIKKMNDFKGVVLLNYLILGESE